MITVNPIALIIFIWMTKNEITKINVNCSNVQHISLTCIYTLLHETSISLLALILILILYNTA